jgi:heavy metal sensor kinase
MTPAPSSVRARLTLWHAATLALVICVFASAVFLFVRARLYGALDAQIGLDLASVERVYREEPGDLAELDHRIGLRWFEVVEGDRVLYRTAAWPPGADRPYRRSTLTDASHRITVARDATGVRQALRTLAIILAVGVPGAVVLAIAGGYVLAGRMLSPVGAMAETARRITAESLGDRLPVENPHDEFGRLATVINETFARLERAFEQLRRFTADASHELRTPLTAMRSVGEVALQRPLDATAYREVIGSMLEEVDRLTRLVENLLTLTRAEGGRIALVRQPADLGVLAAGVTEHLRVLAEDKEQSLTVDVTAAVSAACDPTVLRSGLVNLLHNAIKYTPAKGAICVSVRRTAAGEASIDVVDSGPGIAAGHQGRVFERFYRVDAGRSRDAGGVGLGLAIARWAVEANGGRLELESDEGRGSIFRIVLPALPPT